MENQVTEAGVNEGMEIVENCEKHAIDEITEMSVCNEVPAPQFQQDVIVDCSHDAEEEDTNSVVLEIESSNSQASEIVAVEACVLQLVSSHKNEDVIVEQENKMDQKEDTAKIGTSPSPGENVPSDQLQNTVECVRLLETDFIPLQGNKFSKQLSQEIQVPQVAEACEKKGLTYEGTVDAVKDQENSCSGKILTKNLSELSVNEDVEELNGAETTKEDHHVDNISVGEPDAAVLETTASIEEVNVENTANLNLEPVNEDPILRRFRLLKKQVDRSLNLCSKSLAEDFLSVKKFFEEIDEEETLLQEMASKADLLKSILESAEQLPEELKVSVLDHLEACFHGGHWLEKSVKTKQLAECRQLLNKNYVSLRYSGISKVKSIIEQHSQGTSKSPIPELPQEDVQEASCDPFLVTVTYIIDPGEFYIVRLCDKAKLDRILSELRDNASSYPIPSEITPGIVYAVCNSGLNWFRGSCGKQCGSQVIGDYPAEILYEFFMIDQGHHERIPASSIRILPQELSDYPPFAHECTLNHNFQGAPWSIQATTLFKQMTRQSLMNMKVFSQHGGVLEVDLGQLIIFGEAANIVSVRDALFLSHRPSSTEPPRKKFNRKFSVEELDHFRHFSVIVTAAESPNNIYFQVVDEQFTEYRQMKQELQNEMENASTPLSFSQIQKGYICAAKYRGLWYRCMVEEIYQHNRLSIFYVDTGHRQGVNCSDCFNLPERFSRLPAQAIRCKLDGILSKNPRVPISYKNRRNQSPWSRESMEMVRRYRDSRGVVIVEHWIHGDVGRVDQELTACVVLYKDGDKSSLNFCLSHNDYVATIKNQSHPEHAAIRSSLAAQRRISLSTSINSVGSGLCAPSTDDVSIASPIPFEMSTLSQPLICVSDSMSTNPISIDTAVQVEKKGQRDVYQEDGESTQAGAPSGSSGHLSSTDQPLVGDPLSTGNVTDLLPSVKPAINAQESIACDVSSSTELPVSASEANAILFNEAATGSNIEAHDCITTPWNHYEFQFVKASTSESRKNDMSFKTPMDKPPLEDICPVSNPGIGPLVQDTLIDLTSEVIPQSSAVHPSILATTSNQRDKRNVNKTDANPGGDSSFKCIKDAEIVSTQGTQPDCETSIKVFFVWVDSPAAIFFRTADMQNQFQSLRHEMKKYYGRNKRSQGKFDVGFRCAVKADRSWWRAEVVCVEDFPKCKVSFVDTGYQRTVNARDIYPLINEFDEIKRLVLMCSLCGVYSGTGDEKWKDETINHIRDRLMGSEEIHILKRGPESKYSPLPIMCLYLYDVEGGPLQIPGLTQINLNEELVTMGLAYHCSKPLLFPKHVRKISTWKSPELPKPDSTFWGVVTWVNLVGEIFLHDVKSSDKLKEIATWLNDAYKDTEPSLADLNCSPGDLCIARYQLDKKWYRAIVKRTFEPESVEVFFVDYGTYDAVDRRDIRLKIMLEEVPIIAICCKLFNVRPLANTDGKLEWQEGILNQIHKEIVDHEFRIHVRGRGRPLPIVMLDNMQQSYSESLVQRNWAVNIDPTLKNRRKKKYGKKK